MSGLHTAFHAWFTAQGWTPFPFQEEVWTAYFNGESGVIHAPTGTGKTYGAWSGALNEFLNASPDSDRSRGASRGEVKVKPAHTPPLTVLWITPMRALAGDTANALQMPPTPSPVFVLCHEPIKPKHGYALAGHLHPAVRMVGAGRQTLKLPCFWFGAKVGVLPSFGGFTDSGVVTPARGDQVYVIADDRVMWV